MVVVVAEWVVVMVVVVVVIKGSNSVVGGGIGSVAYSDNNKVNDINKNLYFLKKL